MIAGFIAGSGGAALVLAITQLLNKNQRGGSSGAKPEAAAASSTLEERSTTSSAAGGVAAYETRKAVDEYLQFHFGADEDILPYKAGPKVLENADLSPGFIVNPGDDSACAVVWPSLHHLP
jgi:hypothetical protein